MTALENYYRQLAESLQTTMHRMPAIGVNTAQDLGERALNALCVSLNDNCTHTRAHTSKSTTNKHKQTNKHANTHTNTGLVVRALQDSERLLDEIEAHTVPKEDTTQTFLEALDQLCRSLQDEKTELQKCHGSLAAAATLETLERSLKIQDIQCSS
jgi:hypothetical protein